MSEIKFSAEQKEMIVKKIKGYFNEELDQEIGQFDAEFLLDFFSETVGSYYYNQGLLDAEAVLSSKLDQFSEALYEIEKPTDFSI